MARSKSRFQINAEYGFAKGLILLLKHLPLTPAEALAYGILRTILIFMPKRRKMMNAHLKLSLEELNETQISTVSKQSLKTLARGIATFPRIPHYFSEKSPSWISFEGLPYLEAALAQGKGVIAMTAHYGSWELMSAAIMKRNPIVAAVYRPLDNPRLDAYVAHIRRSLGGEVIDRRHLLRQGLKWLKNNGILGVLIDQNFAAGGVFVNFFGRPAATSPILSIIARRTGAAILPLHSRWEGKELQIIWGKPLVLSKNLDTDRAIAEDTQAMTSIVEGWIRQDPGQWLWLHNRWKRQPQAGDTIFQG